MNHLNWRSEKGSHKPSQPSQTLTAPSQTLTAMGPGVGGGGGGGGGAVQSCKHTFIHAGDLRLCLCSSAGAMHNQVVS